MTDFVNKIITLIMIFVLLVIAPLTISYMTDEMTMQRLVLNEVSQFIDVVTDKGSIRKEDLDDLYLGVNSCGGTFNVDVKRLIRVASEHVDPDTGNPEIQNMFFSDDRLDILNTGDVVKVTVEEVGISPTKRFIWNVLRIDSGKFKFSLAGSVR